MTPDRFTNKTNIFKNCKSLQLNNIKDHPIKFKQPNKNNQNPD